MNKNEEIDELLSRAVAEVIDREHLVQALKSGKKLRVKLGIDPTGAKLHLGHAVVLRILRRFQDMGHTAVLIIGDTTTLIGDPSGKNETRPQLTAQEIENNFKTYEKQALKILDKNNLEIHHQSEWFGKFGLADMIKEASKLSAGWITSHETFRNRLKNGQPLGLHELLYPLVQAYDSVAVKADVELGGMDQKFNLLTGRELMRAHKMEPQDVVLSKYLIGTDGQKMGKTTGNFIALEEEPNEMFGKAMTIMDEVIVAYFELVTDVQMHEVEKYDEELKKYWNGDQSINPRDIKKRLATKIVNLYHGEEAASVASKEWEKVFTNKEKPSEIEDFRIGSVPVKNFAELLVVSGMSSSTSASKILIEQGGVELNDKKVTDWKEKPNLEDEPILKVGKRKFKRIKK